MAAFARALADGADGIELDVHVCRTGEAVVFHDFELQRLAGRPEAVARLPWRELRRVELRGGGAIPLLEDVLAFAADALVNVEIKSRRLGGAHRTTTAVLTALRRIGDHSRVLISSFDPGVLAEVRGRAPHVPCGYLCHRRQSLALRRGWPAMMLGLAAVHPDHELINRQSLRRWQRRGLLVNAWTVDEETRIRHLAELGVDAIITNDPARARRAVAVVER